MICNSFQVWILYKLGIFDKQVVRKRTQILNWFSLFSIQQDNNSLEFGRDLIHFDYDNELTKNRNTHVHLCSKIKYAMIENPAEQCLKSVSVPGICNFNIVWHAQLTVVHFAWFFLHLLSLVEIKWCLWEQPFPQVKTPLSRAISATHCSWYDLKSLFFYCLLTWKTPTNTWRSFESIINRMQRLTCMDGTVFVHKMHPTNHDCWHSNQSEKQAKTLLFFWVLIFNKFA